MTGYVYDEEASADWRMDVVHDAPDTRPAPTSRWVDAMRLLNGIDDPLARKLVALHRDCGSGTGQCDVDGDATSMADRSYWGCETVEVIASHFGLEYPASPNSG